MAEEQQARSVHEAPISDLGLLGEISIAFTVDRVLEVTTPEDGLGGIVFTERPVSEPYVIDHDAREGEGPTRWPKRFDVSNWGLLFATVDGHRCGGVLVAFDTRNLFMLEGRRDVAALWDLRIDREFRGIGVGSALVRAAEGWATSRGCALMKIETQNVNVTACEFYVRQGYTLRSIDAFAYDGHPEETELIFVKRLRKR